MAGEKELSVSRARMFLLLVIYLRRMGRIWKSKVAFVHGRFEGSGSVLVSVVITAFSEE